MATKPQEEIRTVPLHEEDEDKRYRVRDRNTKEGPGKVWGEDLDFETATKLKERVVGSGRSTTARIEDMGADPRAAGPQSLVTPASNGRHRDATIASVQAKALAAGRGAAQAAQARADKVAQDRALAEAAARAAALEDATPPVELDDLANGNPELLDGEIDGLTEGGDAEFQ